jgi:membrane-associated protein
MVEPLATIVDMLLRWLRPVYQDAGYVVVGLGVLLERSMFIGLIVPGDVLLALGGVYAAEGKLSLPLVILLGIAAAVTGESIGWWIGQRYGIRFVRRLPLIRRLEPRLKKSEEFFQQRGAGFTVAIGRYATAAGAFVPFTAGLGRMPYRRFLLWDAPAIVVWATGITLFGYLAGRNIGLIDRALSRFGYIVLGLVVAFFAGRWLWKRYTERRSGS